MPNTASGGPKQHFPRDDVLFINESPTRRKLFVNAMLVVTGHRVDSTRLLQPNATDARDGLVPSTVAEWERMKDICRRMISRGVQQ